MKATFNITLIYPNGFTALSNMPPKGEQVWLGPHILGKQTPRAGAQGRERAQPHMPVCSLPRSQCPVCRRPQMERH